MATYRIECVDSATGNTNENSGVTTVDGQKIAYDTLLRDTWEYRKGYLATSVFMMFQDVSLTFLNNVKINSIQLCFKQGQVFNSGTHEIVYLNERIPPNKTSGLQSIKWSDGAVGRAKVKNDGEWYSIPISDLNVLSNITTKGIMLRDPADDAYISCRVYGYRSAIEANRPYIIIDYLDSNTPPTVTALTPKQSLLSRHSPIDFTWSYSQVLNEPQSHYDLQFYRNGAWETIANKLAGDVRSHTAPANTLPAGDIAWRVRGWLKGSVASAWSEASFVLAGSPDAPSITGMTNTPKPFITWRADVQTGFHIKAGSYYDSGMIKSTAREFRVPVLIPDGTVNVQLRVCNAEGYWSGWASTNVTIVNKKGSEIILNTDNSRHSSAVLNWNIVGGYAAFFVLRDNIPIAKVSGTTIAYEDYLAIGYHEYTVRGVSNLIAGYYTDSNTQGETIYAENAVISLIDKIEWLKLEKRKGGRPARVTDPKPAYTYHFYEGRAKPVAYKGEQVENTLTVSFTLKKLDDYKILYSMLNKTVIYKDCMGACIIGNLDGLSTTADRGYDFEIKITEIDYREKVDYA